MIKKLKIVGFRFLFIFVIGFVLTLSFPFRIFPNIGKFISPIIEPVNHFWAKLFLISEDSYFKVISDSTGLFLNLVTLILVSLIGSFVWTLLQKESDNSQLKKWFRIGVAYYLALILLKYGFDKVFKHQFYLPEPNTLFTPLGDLSKDILFWSSMGSSYTYSVFSGLIELLPAILLLFRKTRLLGALIAMMVMVNVIMLNFGFDISVKVYSTFLFGLTLIIIAPNFKTIYSFFLTQKSTQQKIEPHQFKSQKQVLIYAIVKSLIIGLFLFESLGGYFETNNFNDDNFPRPYLHGAYSNIESDQTIKRIFIHRKQYFIIQNNKDRFTSYKLEFSENLSQLILTDYFDNKYVLNLRILKNGNLFLNGQIKNEPINIETTKEDLSKLPLLNGDSFNWRFD